MNAIAAPVLGASVAEVLGPAGAGKTTFIRALRARERGIRDGLPLTTLQKLNAAVRVGSEVMGTDVHAWKRCRSVTRDELGRLVHLEGWLRALVERPGGPVVFDHGPIFSLGMINAFGSELTMHDAFARWARGVTERWARVLDLVIVLDAPNAALIERIETRHRSHIVKGKPVSEAVQFLDRCRESFERTLTALRSSGGTKVIHFDTARTPVDAIVDDLILLTCNTEWRSTSARR